MATETEQLVVSLEARIRDFERNFQRAGKTANDNFGRIERRAKQSADKLESTMAGAASRIGGVFKSFSAGFVGGFVAAGAGGIISQFGDIAKSIASIGDEAKRAGLSTKAFQELKYVAEQNRIGVDSLVDGIKELNLRADEFITTGKGSAAEAFGRLGYSADDLKRKLRDPSALFVEIIGRLNQLDRAASIRIADEIFGGTGGEKFVQLIEQGEQGIRDQIKAANDLGVVLDDEVIARADEIDRKFQAITTTIGTGLKGAIVDAISALSTFIDTFRKIESRQTETLQDQLDFHQRNLSAAQAGKDRMGAAGGLVFDRQIATSQSEVDRLRQVLRDRALDSIRDDLTRSNAMYAGTTPGTKGDRVPPATPTVPATGTGRSTASRDSSAGSAQSERQAVAELIAELEEELRLIGATDQQRRAADASRRAGAAATDAERAKIVALNEAIYQEEEARAAANDKLQQAADIGRNFVGGFLSDLRSGVSPVQAFANAVSRLADTIIDQLVSAMFDVQGASSGGGLAGGIVGLLGNLFGFSRGGIVKADAWEGLRLAGGGHVRGPGTSKSDSIPAKLSDGEFVVNAAATAKHLPMLEAINRGTVPAFASGGMMGKPIASNVVGGGGGGGPVFAPSVQINIEGGSRGREADQALAENVNKQISRALEAKMAEFAVKNMRNGGMFNRREFT